MKKLWKSFLLVLAMSLLFSSVGFAKSDQAKKSLVALGDSIPFGYNLGVNNDHPSKLAYPYIMGDKANMRVRDLGVPGWTTMDQLTAIQNDEKYREAIRHADVITLSIGNNDLLGALSRSGGNAAVILGTVQDIVTNLKQIVYEIRDLNPNAPIVIYNIYNPFQQGTDLNYLALQLLPPINMIFNQQITSMSGLNVHLADAFSAFGNSGQYVRLGDIHPTVEGQMILAEVGLAALK